MSSPTGAPASTTRCSTRPVVVMSTSMIRVGSSGEQLDVAHDATGVSDGYWTTAT